MHEVIKLPFGLVSGIDPGIGVFVHCFEWRFGECIRLVREKFIIFPFGQYTNGNVVYSSVL